MIKDKVAFIGLGACGSNIALLFQKRGYTCFYINGSEQDNKALAGARNILKLRDHDGFGGSREISEIALAKNLEIIDEIKKIKEEIIYLVFSTAGSTGSGLAPILCDIIYELNESEGFNKTVCCIAVLPRRDEALQKHINAYNCLIELAEKEDIGSCILVDNNKMDSLGRINATVVHHLDCFFTDESYSNRGNVDVSEKMRMIKQQGMMVISAVCNGKASKPVEYLEALLTKNVFAPVESDGIVEYIAVINSIETPVKVDMIMKAVGIPQNVFTGYGAKKTITIVSGLSFPFTYISEIKEQAEEKYQERMQSRNKMGGMLKELNFGSPVSAVQEKPIKKKLNRLEMLRNLQGGL